MYNYSTAIQEFLIIFRIVLRLQEKLDPLLKHPQIIAQLTATKLLLTASSYHHSQNLLISRSPEVVAVPVSSRLAGDGLFL